MPEDLLTPETLSNRWGVTPNTLSQWRWNGRGPKFLKIGRRVLYRLQEVESFEEQKQHKSTSTYQSWLKEKTSASPSASFAADGSIYILNPQENTLARYYNGRLGETLQLKISPNLSTVTRIKTEKGLKNLYLSDPNGQRVIIINKKGELVKQYTSPEFTDLTDIEISSDESQLFVAANKKIYEINLNQ